MAKRTADLTSNQCSVSHGWVFVMHNRKEIERFKQFGFRQVRKSCDKGPAIMRMEY